MYNIVYSENFYHKLDFFIEKRLESFVNRFTDTGIENEFLIVGRYIEESKELKNSILDNVEKTFTKDKILAFKVISDIILETTIVVSNYRLYIKYIEKDNFRIIKNIDFVYI